MEIECNRQFQRQNFAGTNQLTGGAQSSIIELVSLFPGKKTAPRKDDAITNYHSRNHMIFTTPSLFGHNLSHLTSWHSHHWNDRFYSNFTRTMDTPRTIFDKNFRSKEKRCVLLLGLEPIGVWICEGTWCQKHTKH